MRAYRLTTYGPGGLQPADVAEPTAAAGQVRLRVEHIGVNALDWKIRNGFLADMLPLPLPVVLGSEASGTVLEVGGGVDDLQPGDRVTGFVDSGAYAAEGVTRRERLSRVPEDLDLQTAAALPTSAEAALRTIGLLSPSASSTLVVNGAAGAVGSVLTQLLVADGHTVIGTASVANHEFVRSLGATPVSYGDGLASELRAAAPDGIDGAIDTAGRDFVARVADAVDASRIVTLVDFAAGARGAIVAGGDPTQITAESIGPVLERAAGGGLTVQIAEVFAFDRLDDALSLSEGGHLRGKIVLTGPEAPATGA